MDKKRRDKTDSKSGQLTQFSAAGKTRVDLLPTRFRGAILYDYMQFLELNVHHADKVSLASKIDARLTLMRSNLYRVSLFVA